MKITLSAVSSSDVILTMKTCTTLTNYSISSTPAYKIPGDHKCKINSSIEMLRTNIAQLCEVQLNPPVHPKYQLWYHDQNTFNSGILTVAAHSTTVPIAAHRFAPNTILSCSTLRFSSLVHTLLPNTFFHKFFLLSCSHQPSS